MATQTAEVLGRLRLSPPELQRQRQLRTFSWSGIVILVAVAVLVVILSALQQSVSDLATASATGQWDTFFSLDFFRQFQNGRESPSGNTAFGDPVYWSCPTL